LDSIARVQSLTNLFPPDAEARLQKARDIGALAARADYAARITAIERAGLPDPTFQRVRELLEQGLDTIDSSQEQAFSAGHATLVERLERLRGRIEAILEAIDRDAAGGRERSERFLRALAEAAHTGLQVIDTWRSAEALTPDRLPPTLSERFFAADGTVAVYAFPAESVYDPANLDRLMKEVYGISKRATGFPTTHHVLSKAVWEGFLHGTLLAVVVCLIWLILMLRSLTGFVLASLPLLIGGGWMLGVMSLFGLDYNYANIIALPLVIALAVDYGVWFSHRWQELRDQTPVEITRIAGKVIALAAGTELAGLGAISLADYRGVSTMGIDITIGLVCCLMATLFMAPAMAQLLDPRRQA
ncbi:MAG: MMPL family transporter, partial [Beggiatoa sp.]|nr:MMPL family transporter [Beggiatoa sp.]